MSIRVGRMTLNEAVLRAFEEQWNSDGRTVTLSGIMFTDPTLTRARLAKMHDDLLGLPLSLVPVEFDVKSHRNGYYRVIGATASNLEISDQNVGRLGWEMTLVRQGNDTEVDLESRISGPINRLNDHSLGGERWHAPSQPHSAYWIGTATPGQVVRTGSEGAIKVYRSLPATLNPRWHCAVEGYDLGRARILDPTERSGIGVELGTTGWSISNSLISWTPNGNGFDLQAHNGTAWSTAKRFNLTMGGTPLGTPLAVSVLHNEFERVTVRALWNRSPSGRVYADPTLRRGSRFIEIVVKVNAAATLGVVRDTNEAGTAGSGFVRATSNDGDGHRYVIASLKSFTNDLTAGGISKASVVRFDAIVGLEIAGTSAVDGDQIDDLLTQYVGTPSEVVQAVRR